MITAGYVANGAKVFITSRKPDVTAATVEELNKKYASLNGGSVEGIPTDLSTFEGVKHLVEQLKQRTNRLHVLVNNAATSWVVIFYLNLQLKLFHSV